MRPRFGVCVADAVLALSINIALMAQYAPHVPRKAEKKGHEWRRESFHIHTQLMFIQLENFLS